MKLIAETIFDHTHRDYTLLTPPSPLQFLRILIAGEIEGRGSDKRCLIHVNGLNAGYKSYVDMSGDAALGESDTRGFYAGRTGWNMNGELHAEFNITNQVMSNRVVGYGMATYSMADGRILGYRCHGYLGFRGNITSISVSFQDGLFTGIIKVTGS